MNEAEQRDLMIAFLLACDRLADAAPGTMDDTGLPASAESPFARLCLYVERGPFQRGIALAGAALPAWLRSKDHGIGRLLQRIDAGGDDGWGWLRLNWDEGTGGTTERERLRASDDGPLAALRRMHKALSELWSRPAGSPPGVLAAATRLTGPDTMPRAAAIDVVRGRRTEFVTVNLETRQGIVLGGDLKPFHRGMIKAATAKFLPQDLQPAFSDEVCDPSFVEGVHRGLTAVVQLLEHHGDRPGSGGAAAETDRTLIVHGLLPPATAVSGSAAASVAMNELARHIDKTMRVGAHRVIATGSFEDSTLRLEPLNGQVLRAKLATVAEDGFYGYLLAYADPADFPEADQVPQKYHIDLRFPDKPGRPQYPVLRIPLGATLADLARAVWGETFVKWADTSRAAALRDANLELLKLPPLHRGWSSEEEDHLVATLEATISGAILLAGPASCGKSTMALRAVQRLADTADREYDLLCLSPTISSVPKKDEIVAAWFRRPDPGGSAARRVILIDNLPWEGGQRDSATLLNQLSEELAATVLGVAHADANTDLEFAGVETKRLLVGLESMTAFAERIAPQLDNPVDPNVIPVIVRESHRDLEVMLWLLRAAGKRGVNTKTVVEAALLREREPFRKIRRTEAQGRALARLAVLSYIRMPTPEDLCAPLKPQHLRTFATRAGDGWQILARPKQLAALDVTAVDRGLWEKLAVALADCLELRSRDLLWACEIIQHLHQADATEAERFLASHQNLLVRLVYDGVDPRHLARYIGLVDRYLDGQERKRQQWLTQLANQTATGLLSNQFTPRELARILRVLTTRAALLKHVSQPDPLDRLLNTLQPHLLKRVLQRASGPGARIELIDALRLCRSQFLDVRMNQLTDEFLAYNTTTLSVSTYTDILSAVDRLQAVPKLSLEGTQPIMDILAHQPPKALGLMAFAAWHALHLRVRARLPGDSSPQKHSTDRTAARRGQPAHDAQLQRVALDFAYLARSTNAWHVFAALHLLRSADRQAAARIAQELSARTDVYSRVAADLRQETLSNIAHIVREMRVLHPKGLLEILYGPDSEDLVAYISKRIVGEGDGRGGSMIIESALQAEEIYGDERRPSFARRIAERIGINFVRSVLHVDVRLVVGFRLIETIIDADVSYAEELLDDAIGVVMAKIAVHRPWGPQLALFLGNNRRLAAKRSVFDELAVNSDILIAIEHWMADSRDDLTLRSFHQVANVLDTDRRMARQWVEVFEQQGFNPKIRDSDRPERALRAVHAVTATLGRAGAHHRVAAAANDAFDKTGIGTSDPKRRFGITPGDLTETVSLLRRMEPMRAAAVVDDLLIKAAQLVRHGAGNPFDRMAAFAAIARINQDAARSTVQYLDKNDMVQHSLVTAVLDEDDNPHGQAIAFRQLTELDQARPKSDERHRAMTRWRHQLDLIRSPKAVAEILRTAAMWDLDTACDLARAVAWDSVRARIRAGWTSDAEHWGYLSGVNWAIDAGLNLQLSNDIMQGVERAGPLTPAAMASLLGFLQLVDPEAGRDLADRFRERFAAELSLRFIEDETSHYTDLGWCALYLHPQPDLVQERPDRLDEVVPPAVRLWLTAHLHADWAAELRADAWTALLQEHPGQPMGVTDHLVFTCVAAHRDGRVGDVRALLARTSSDVPALVARRLHRASLRSQLVLLRAGVVDPELRPMLTVLRRQLKERLQHEPGLRASAYAKAIRTLLNNSDD
ncbi:hypothetical protein AB0J72_30675 [Dactylosporangium sp. NPDC049742]|uniref:hypothetical protein n=1 Tax=Dactylosporangium sp. NPDC049742 TaxID=3154737 RepID=UPI003424CD13